MGHSNTPNSSGCSFQHKLLPSRTPKNFTESIPSCHSAKVETINKLDEMLRNQATNTFAEMLGAVVYLTTNELYFGSNENVQVHTKGLQELIRMRGGIDGSMNHFLRQMIIL
jgi:hypothetical protein